MGRVDGPNNAGESLPISISNIDACVDSPVSSNIPLIHIESMYRYSLYRLHHHLLYHNVSCQVTFNVSPDGEGVHHHSHHSH